MRLLDRRSWNVLGVALVCGMLLTLAGCNGGGGASAEDTQVGMQRLQMLARFYGRFQAQNQGRFPANEAQFRKFLEGPIAEEVKASGVATIDDLFVSPRDKQPYVVTYKGRPNNPGINGDPIFAYEATGVDGKRIVATLVGITQEVEAAEFAQMVPDAK